MRFGQTNALRGARGKIGVGVALALFGLLAVLSAPTGADKLLCSLVALAGVVFIALGVRQDRSEKARARGNSGETKE